MVKTTIHLVQMEGEWMKMDGGLDRWKMDERMDDGE